MWFFEDKDGTFLNFLDEGDLESRLSFPEDTSGEMKKKIKKRVADGEMAQGFALQMDYSAHFQQIQNFCFLIKLSPQC